MFVLFCIGSSSYQQKINWTNLSYLDLKNEDVDLFKIIAYPGWVKTHHYNMSPPYGSNKIYFTITF
jgi:hypothetical protein